MPRPTLRHVSDAAGVSLFTASRALANQKGVAVETRDRVQRIAAELGYIANQAARNLKHRGNRTIGILTANTANQYYPALVGAIEDELQAAGYGCFVTNAVSRGVYDVERENRFVATLLEQRVSGIIVTYALTEANLALLRQWDLPLLFVDCPPPPGHADLPAIGIDNYAAGLLLGRHLVEHGYRHWAFIGFPAGWSTRSPREHGFAAAASEAGARLDIIEAGTDSASASIAVGVYLDARPEPGARPRAVFAANTPLLHGTWQALQLRGLRVPEDIAVVAFDDFDWAPLLSPPVTVIDQHIATLGQRAGQAMIARLDDLHPAAMPSPVYL
ncbi:MAG TPA: LacI family DNA-binding transcriptional regulator, partial [Dongiaceae bacterium]